MKTFVKRIDSSAYGTLAIVAALIFFAIHSAKAADPIKIAVFNFALDDRSAAGGIIGQDARDSKYLKDSTEEARKMLASSGRYRIVDTASVEAKLAAAGGIENCNGCEAPLARQLGAEQWMVGLVTRVSRTEYTLQVQIKDTRTGSPVSDAFTGLRMGANYSWPRGVEWLVKNRVLSAPHTR
jgi:hypothetical protein